MRPARALRAPFLALALVALALASCALASCVPGSAPPAPVSRTEPVVYGEDGRREPYEVDGTLRALALGSSAAIFDFADLDLRDPSAILPSGRSLQRDEDLCDDQRFLDQPTAASCSGTLIDDDLYLTAGHCIDTEEECRASRFVFDYAYAAEGVLEAERREVERRADEKRETQSQNLLRQKTLLGGQPVEFDEGPRDENKKEAEEENRWSELNENKKEG